MVKLFGWEKKMSATLKDKREEELSWIWKDKVRAQLFSAIRPGSFFSFKKMLTLLNDVIKSVASPSF